MPVVGGIAHGLVAKTWPRSRPPSTALLSAMAATTLPAHNNQFRRKAR